MALDKKFVQDIDLKANGDQLLEPLRAFSREINTAIERASKLADTMSKGAHRTDNELRREVQTIQRMISEASTLSNILNGSGTRKRDSLLSALDDQSVGKKVAAVSRLKTPLNETKNEIDAVNVRLGVLRKSFEELGMAGRKVSKRDLAKELNLQQVETDIRAIDRAMRTLGRAKGRQTPEAMALLGQIQGERAKLLSDLQNPNKTSFTGRTDRILTLLDQYRDAPAAAAKARKALEGEGELRLKQMRDDAKSEREHLNTLMKIGSDRVAQINREAKQVRTAQEAEGSLRLKQIRDDEAAERDHLKRLQTIGNQRIAEIERENRAEDTARSRAFKRTFTSASMSNPMLLASAQRGAGQFAFTRDQAAGFDPKKLDADINGNMVKLQRLRNIMADALEKGYSTRNLERLNSAFDRVKGSISEAIAAQRAFNKQVDESASRESRRANDRAREAALKTANMSDPMQRAGFERAASRYRFTSEQARGFNMPQLGAQIDANVVRLRRLREMMSNAVEKNYSTRNLERLQGVWTQVHSAIAEAIAKQRAYNNLPEQKFAQWREMVPKRIVAGSVIGAGVFAGMNAARDSIKYVLDLEDALKQLQAIAGATTPEMKVLAEGILDVASTTKFSTVEITQAATAIAQAGFSAQETGQVLKDALTLATSSGSSPGEAVDTLTSTLGAFQLQAKESTHVVDVMVEALNRSKLSISQMQAAIQYAGATARESGMSFEELSAIAASLANAGVRSGSTIGTGLRQMLVDLQNPTENLKKELKNLGLTMADVDVRSMGLMTVVKKLTDAGFSAEAAYGGFEVRAAAAFLALRGQVGTYDELAASLSRGGSAADAQATAMDSLSAKWQQMLNVTGKLVVALSGPLVGAATTVVELINGIVSVANAAIGGLDSFGAKIVGVSAIAAAGFAVGGPFGAVIGGIIGLAGALRGASDELDEIKGKANQAKASFDSQHQTVLSLDSSIDNLVQRSSVLRHENGQMQIEAMNLVQKFEGLSTELGNVALNYDNVLAAMMRLRRGELQRDAEKARETGYAKQDEQRALGGAYLQTGSDTAGAAKALQRLGATGAMKPLLERVIAQSGDVFNGRASSQQLLSGEIGLRKTLNDITAARSQNPLKDAGAEKERQRRLDNLIEAMRARINTYTGLVATRNEILNAGRTMATAGELAGDPAQGRMKYYVGEKEATQDLLTQDKRQNHSADAGLNAKLKSYRAKLADYKGQQRGLSTSDPKYLALQQSVLQMNDLIGMILRALAENEEEDKKAARGQKKERPTNYTGAQMKALLEKHFPGIQISSYKQRTAADGKIYKPGSLHARPGGNAVDVTKLPAGVDPNEVKLYMESLGVSVPRTANGFLDEFKNPSKHATGGHYHFGWTPKKSQSETTDDREQQGLVNQLYGFSVNAQKKRIDALLTTAKAGSSPVDDIAQSLDVAIADYTAAKIRQFEAANPVADLSPDALKVREGAHQELDESIAAEVEAYREKFAAQILDLSKKQLNSSWKAADAEFAKAEYRGSLPVTAAQTYAANLDNPFNRSRFGAGTRYRAQQNIGIAEIGQLRSTDDALFRQISDKQGALDLFQARPVGAPGSEQRETYDAEVATRQSEITDLLQKRTVVQAELNARTQEFTNIPLDDRLRDSVAAWAENSGAMNTWAKTLEDSIGPALDLFTNQLASMFEAIATGSQTVKQAMLDFISAFAKMVTQIIAKALALMAVKAILSAFGLQLNSGPGGTTIGKAPKGQLTGGPAGEPRKFMGGGSPDPYINRGVSNRDTVPALLARNEYVVRGSSVDSLGLPFMDAINRHGAKALGKMGGMKPILTGGGRQEMNVYMIRPEEQPQLGPNDIKLVIADDILQGGQTKQLIKRVMQGG